MCNPYQNQLLFRKSAFSRIPDDAYGIYGIWFRHLCVYVGKAEIQTIGERLEQHWKSSHNSKLQTWINAKGPELRVAYKIVPERSKIDTLERYYIRRFQPITNDIMYTTGD